MRDKVIQSELQFIMRKWYEYLFIRHGIYALIVAIWTTLMPTLAFAQSTTVRTSKELQAILGQNKDFGVILLDGDLFCIDNIDVLAGGVVKPATGRIPLITGDMICLNKSEGVADEGRNTWRTKLEGFTRKDFYAMNASFERVPISGIDGGLINVEFHERDVKILDKEKRKISLPIPDNCPELKNKSAAYFKNTTMKLSCWFHCMNVSGIYSDANRLYGYVEDNYSFQSLGQHSNMSMYGTFFNLPDVKDIVYVDKDNYIHVPNMYPSIYIGWTSTMMNIKTTRILTFKDISFACSDLVVKMGNNTANKHFVNCGFSNCGKGIDFSNHVKDAEGNFSVDNCRFYDLYSNSAIYVMPVKNVTVSGNKIEHTGFLNKGGAVVSVSADNFTVENNSIHDFSYNGIVSGIHMSHKDNNVIKGVIRNNMVDQGSRVYGNPACQLYDGGGIYIYGHVNSVLVENNIICNVGFHDGLRFGLYLDGGAYNVTARNNLVYHNYPGQAAIHARYIVSEAPSDARNYFTGNIVVGDCVFGGNKTGAVPIVEGNYISGTVSQWNNNGVSISNNRTVKAKEEGDKVYIDRGVRIKKSNYSKMVRSIINNRKRLK